MKRPLLSALMFGLLCFACGDDDATDAGTPDTGGNTDAMVTDVPVVDDAGIPVDGVSAIDTPPAAITCEMACGHIDTACPAFAAECRSPMGCTDDTTQAALRCIIAAADCDTVMVCVGD